ncbi:unnamed protein product [Cunninghamella blakesleeana]
MIIYFSSILLSILLILSNHIHSYYCQGTNRQIHGRVFPGCALVNDSIYCFGGFIGAAMNVGANYNNPVNDHVALDLTPFGDFSVIERQSIQWTNKSNTINGVPLGEVGQLTTSTLADGSYVIYGGRYVGGNTQPFAVYHYQSDQWEGLTLPNNNTFFVFSQIVNTGHDQIWIWGGAIAGSPSETLVSNTLYNFNYNNKIWSTGQPSTGNSLAYHTATLANNTIYLIGGVSFTNSSLRVLVDFNQFRTYNTIDSSWGNITALGPSANSRAHHTTVATDDEKNLIIYGGSQYLKGGFRAVDDTYYVYNIESNRLQRVNMTNPPGATTHHRYGHFATIYKSIYLILVFGYSDASTATADNFNVLNIQNISNPTWVSFIGANGNPTPEGSRGVDLKTVVPAVVVPIVVVLSSAAIAYFLIIRHRKRKQERQFILEQEDPRKLMDQNVDNNPPPVYSEEIASETRYTLNNEDEHNGNRMSRSNHHEVTKPSDPNDSVKPSELKETTKPFENHP